MSDLIITEKSNITAIANNIRSLTGTTDALTLGQMATIKGSGTGENLDEEMSQQNQLLTELETVIDSKAAGGSGGGSVKTCTVTIESQVYVYSIAVSVLDVSTGDIKAEVVENKAQPYSGIFENVVCGSVIYGSFSGSGLQYDVTNCDLLHGLYSVAYSAPVEQDAVGSILVYSNL